MTAIKLSWRLDL